MTNRPLPHFHMIGIGPKVQADKASFHHAPERTIP